MLQDVAPDSLRRALGEVFTRPDYQWVERRRPLLATLVDWWNQLLTWIDGLSDNNPFAFNILLIVAVVVLLALLAHIGYVVWRIVQPSARTGTAAGGPAAAQVLDAHSHLVLAEELARAGRYAEALAHRFLAVVLDLERAEALRFHVSKTPAEYVGEVRLDDAGRATFATLVARLYRHLFGAQPCDETDYRDFGATADRLRAHVVPV